MEFDLNNYIMHHVLDSKEWHLPFLPGIHLPGFLTLHGVMLVLCSLFLILVFCVLYKKTTGAPSGLTNMLEAIVVFIRDDVAIPAAGEEDGRKLTPLFCTFFFFILTLNLMGLIPVFATATGNVNVTAALALITFGFMIIGGIQRTGFKVFVQSFIPPHVPLPILFIVVPIEFLGLFIKPFALTVRLFANMFAGHVVILALLGLVVVIGVYALPSILLAVFISLLEILVAFLQAYIFTLLSATFIGQRLHPEH